MRLSKEYKAVLEQNDEPIPSSVGFQAREVSVRLKRRSHFHDLMGLGDAMLAIFSSGLGIGLLEAYSVDPQMVGFLRVGALAVAATLPLALGTITHFGLSQKRKSEEKYVQAMIIKPYERQLQRNVGRIAY